MTRRTDDEQPPVGSPPDDPPRKVESLKTAATRGMLWESLAAFSARGMGFAATIALTHWMPKAEYGRANAAFTIANVVRAFGSPFVLGELVRRRQRFEEAASLYFVYGSALICMLTAIVFIFAEPVCAAFNAPGAVYYTRVGLIIPPLYVVLSNAQVVLNRRMHFSRIGVLEFSGASANAGLAVGMAVNGFGGLAVIIGQVAREVVIRIGGIMSTGFGWLRRPALTDWGLLREMLAFGVPVYLSVVCEYASTHAPNLIVSRFYGPAALGQFAVALTLAYTPSGTLSDRVASVVYATVARFSEDRERRVHALLRSLGATTMLLCPVMVVTMLCGPRIVAILLPGEWTVMVAALVTALSPVAIGVPWQKLVDYYAQVIDRPSISLVTLAAKGALVLIALLTVGRTSLVAAGWAIGGAFVVAAIGALVLIAIVERIAAAEMIRQLLPGLVGSALCAFVIFTARRLAFDSELAMLLIETSAGAVAYVAYLLAFHRDRLVDIVSGLRGR